MFPFSSTSIFSDAGIFGSPGIVNMFPVSITINPAPVFNITSFTCILNGSSHNKFFASSENEYCVFAIHTGNFPYPCFCKSSIFLFASSVYSTPSAPYIFVAIFSIFCFILSSKS